MNRLRSILTPAIGFLVALNIGFFWRHLTRDSSAPPVPEVKSTPAFDSQARSEKSVSLLEGWYSAEALDVAELELDFAKLPRGELNDLPAKAESLTFDSLTESQKDNLSLAVSELLDAYATNTPDAIFDYMRKRREHLAPDIRRQTEASLREAGISFETGMSDREFFKFAWGALRLDSGWRSIVAGSEAFLLWRLDRYTEAYEKTLGRSSKSVFKNLSTAHHLFNGNRQFRVAGRSEPILFCDFSLVVNVEIDGFERPNQHFIRFWFDHVTGLWLPAEHVAVGTVDKRTANFVF